MMTTSVEAERFPSVEVGDVDAVAVALETGRALWGRGDPGEAVRWLRRAAEHAEESGNDMRALSLARVAAELTTDMQTAPPASVAPVETAAPAPPASAPLSSSASGSRRPLPPSSRAPSPPSPPSPPSARTHSAPTASSSPLQRPPAHTAETTPAAPSVRPSIPPRPAPISAAHPKAKRHGAVRVAVQGEKADGSLSITVLDVDQKAPSGAVEALLVPLDADVDLLRRL
jgi:hypothetical protein